MKSIKLWFAILTLAVKANAFAVTPVDDIANLFWQNEIRAAQSTEGRLMQIEGQVADIGTTVLKNPYIRLQTSNYKTVIFYFDVDQIQAISFLNKRENVVIEGTGAGISLGMLVFKNCKLITADVMQERLALKEKRDKEFQERQARDMLAYELSCYPIKKCIVTEEPIDIKNSVKYIYYYPKQKTVDYTRPTEQIIFFSNKSTISIFEKSPEVYLEKLNKIIYDTVKFDVTNLYGDRFFITNTGFYRLDDPIISISVKGEVYTAKTESFLQVGNRWKLVPENFVSVTTNKPCETFIGIISVTIDVPQPVGKNNVKLTSSTVNLNIRVIP
jgi:hypothetical protein